MAYGVKPQKFLCCLPVRLGVFVLSLLHFFVAGLVAVALWVSLWLKDLHYNRGQKISVIFAAIFYTFFATYAILAFYGTIRRRLSLVQFYAEWIAYMLGISLVLGIVHIVMMFTTSKQKFIDECIDGRTDDDDVVDACQHVTTVRFVVVGFFVVAWVVGLYECIIVSRYAKQLQEENQEKHRLKTMKTSLYDTVPGRESTEAFAGSYSDASAHAGYSGESKLYGTGPHQ